MLYRNSHGAVKRGDSRDAAGCDYSITGTGVPDLFAGVLPPEYSST